MSSVYEMATSHALANTSSPAWRVAVPVYFNAGKYRLPPYEGFFLYYPSRAQIAPKLRVFIDCVLENARGYRHSR